jgi:hypothetical protein
VSLATAWIPATRASAGGAACHRWRSLRGRGHGADSGLDTGGNKRPLWLKRAPRESSGWWWPRPARGGESRAGAGGGRRGGAVGGPPSGRVGVEPRLECDSSRGARLSTSVLGFERVESQYVFSKALADAETGRSGPPSRDEAELLFHVSERGDIDRFRTAPSAFDQRRRGGARWCGRSAPRACTTTSSPGTAPASASVPGPAPPRRTGGSGWSRPGSAPEW